MWPFDAFKPKQTRLEPIPVGPEAPRPVVPGFRPYEARSDESTDWEQISANVSANLKSFGSRIQRPGDYAMLLGFLAADRQRYAVESADEFAAPASRSTANKVRLFLRHDVDLDIVGAETMAKIENALGMRSSYYLLHSHSIYYGHFDRNGVFLRYDSLLDTVGRIQALGQDIGLHIDPLGIFGRNRVDGVQAMLAEIEHLRRNGIDCFSVCAHNSSSVYNAQNKDVFAGENVSGQEFIELEDGLRVPLGTVDAAAAGIRIIGDFNRTISTEPLPRSISPAYGFVLDRTPVLELQYDVGFSILLDGVWEVNGKADFLGGVYSFPNDCLTEALSKVPPGRKVVLNIHPMYYGRRD